MGKFTWFWYLLDKLKSLGKKKEERVVLKPVKKENLDVIRPTGKKKHTKPVIKAAHDKKAERTKPPENIIYPRHREGNVEAYIRSDVLGKMIQHAIDNEKEIIGFLLTDKRRKWNGGEYPVVTDREFSDKGLKHTVADVILTDKTRGAIFEKLDTREKKGEEYFIIGWYHSHPGHGCFFSHTDIHTQKTMFKKKHQIGIVIDPLHNELAVYRLAKNKNGQDTSEEVKYAIYGNSVIKLVRNKKLVDVLISFENKRGKSMGYKRDPKKIERIYYDLKEMEKGRTELEKIGEFRTLIKELLEDEEKGEFSFKKDPKERHITGLYNHILSEQKAGRVGEDITFYLTLAIIRYFYENYYKVGDKEKLEFVQKIQKNDWDNLYISELDVDKVTKDVKPGGLGKLLNIYLRRIDNSILESGLDVEKILKNTKDSVQTNTHRVGEELWLKGMQTNRKRIPKEKYFEGLHIWFRQIIGCCADKIVEEWREEEED